MEPSRLYDMAMSSMAETKGDNDEISSLSSGNKRRREDSNEILDNDAWQPRIR